MNYRELLEAAAKAAGMPYAWCSGAEMMLHTQPDANALYWRPLEDDGDALRLAARLKIDLHYEWNGPTLGDIVEAMSPDREDGSRWCMDESTSRDCAAATRRAIVRAAAAMAKQGVTPNVANNRIAPAKIGKK